VAVLGCTLRFTLIPHTAQIVTGFALLERAGIVRTQVEEWPAPPPSPSIVEVSVEGVTVAYDMIDSCRVRSSVSRYAGTVDAYFKRSHDPAHPVSANARPLGLNYPVAPGPGWVAGEPALPPLAALEGRPQRPDGDPRVIFFTRLWNPLGEPDEPELRDGSHEQERVTLNEGRAGCVRALRKAFGARFVGGIVATEYAVERVPELVVSSEVTAKGRYLEQLHEADVGVSTVGLHGSVPWKFGEYVAAAKAIVTHPLTQSVPGPLKPRANYLAFGTPEECVDAATRLAGDADLLHEMKVDNCSYYHGWLRPDRLVLNSLLTALS
jgi:hypothetical protein